MESKSMFCDEAEKVGTDSHPNGTVKSSPKRGVTWCLESTMDDPKSLPDLDDPESQDEVDNGNEEIMNPVGVKTIIYTNSFTEYTINHHKRQLELKELEAKKTAETLERRLSSAGIKRPSYLNESRMAYDMDDTELGTEAYMGLDNAVSNPRPDPPTPVVDVDDLRKSQIAATNWVPKGRLYTEGGNIQSPMSKSKWHRAVHGLHRRVSVVLPPFMKKKKASKAESGRDQENTKPEEGWVDVDLEG